nr:hypothetical protein [Tanacetum cinerariifolium]
IEAIGPPRPFKDGWHNSSIVWRSGTGGSPFPSAAISKSFKRVGSTQDLLQIARDYQEPVTAKNKANKIAGPKEANNSAEAKNGDQNLNGDTGSKTYKEPVDEDDQAFMEELERLKRQAKETDDAAETLRKTIKLLCLSCKHFKLL